MTLDELANALQSDCADVQIKHGELTLELPAGDPQAFFLALRDTHGFDTLIDVCGIDYLTYAQSEWVTQEATCTGFDRAAEAVREAHAPDAVSAERTLAVVYHLLSTKHNLRLRLRYFTPDRDRPLAYSACAVWPAANWFEREAFDLFGIVFEGHPDLRRILTDYGFIGSPFRKDFPLTGRVEMRYDADAGRVVYEPVSIEPRTLVPRVIRESASESNPAAQEQD